MNTKAKLFKEQLIELSKANDNSAFNEWIYTGMSVDHDNLMNCICSTPIHYRHHIKNPVTNKLTIIGEDCANKYAFPYELKQEIKEKTKSYKQATKILNEKQFPIKYINRRGYETKFKKYSHQVKPEYINTIRELLKEIDSDQKPTCFNIYQGKSYIYTKKYITNDDDYLNIKEYLNYLYLD